MARQRDSGGNDRGGWQRGGSYDGEGRYNAEPYNYGGHYSDYGGVPYSGYYGPAEWGANPRAGAQNHTGRGPRNYQRSDEAIRDDVNEELTRHPGVDATDIDVRVSNGDVTLTGTVDDRGAKRMAEDAAESCCGVKDVHNQIRIGNAPR